MPVAAGFLFQENFDKFISKYILEIERNILEPQTINIFVFMTKMIQPLPSYQNTQHHISKDSNPHRTLYISLNTAVNPINDMNVHLQVAE
jgi:hypothetical protein